MREGDPCRMKPASSLRNILLFFLERSRPGLVMSHSIVSKAFGVFVTTPSSSRNAAKPPMLTVCLKRQIACTRSHLCASNDKCLILRESEVQNAGSATRCCPASRNCTICITDEEAGALARTTVNPFKVWNLSYAEAVILLGDISARTWTRWKERASSQSTANCG